MSRPYAVQRFRDIQSCYMVLLYTLLYTNFPVYSKSSKPTHNKNIMTGIVKRKDTWYACFRVGGKNKVNTTGIKICPVVPSGKTKTAAMKEAELQARIIADELEKEAKGATLNVEIIVSLAGNKAKSILRNKRHIPNVNEHLNKWLAERPDWRTNTRYAKAIRSFLEFLGSDQHMPLDAVTEAHARKFMDKHLNFYAPAQ